MMNHFKRMFLMLVFLVTGVMLFGQGATTSSLAGRIVDNNGAALPGATVLATHVPSGTQYGAIANDQGFFTIQGMRPGGPYTIEVSFVGFSTKTFTDISLQLGETYNLRTSLAESASQLGEVVVVGSRPSAFGTERMGASSNINTQEMALIPSMNRNLGDYTKLSPYSTGGGYAGREAYTTNVTIDGANFNNNFGLSGSSMPGVSGEPISMEAIEEIQVAVAPFDVTQSNFTGAGVNAITKSGTNQFRASVYGYYRDTSMVGKKIRDQRLKVSQSSKKVYGMTLGGPIIKNKLFFFVSAEKESTLTPGNTLLAMTAERDANDPNVNSRVQAADLQKFSDLLKTKYGYETGRYENWGGDDEYNNKLLARIDWNINRNNKFSFRYNYSASSARFAPSNSGDATPSISGGRQSRTGGLSFENSQYYNSNTLNSITGELNSRFGQFSNKLLVAYTKYGQPRTSDSQVFPFIDIMSGNATSGQVYMSAGYELFSYKNNVDNNTFIATDNLTYQLDRHNFTLGTSFEHQYFANSYLRQGSGYYRFRDLTAFESFVNGAGLNTDGTNKPFNAAYDPINFALTYPINGFTNPVAELNFGQYSAYLQDEYSVLDNLKVTGGIRVDLPMYFSGAVDNPAVKQVTTFRDGEIVDLSTWPKAKMLWSPRLGFVWNALPDNALKVRGGTGIFTGRIPFVWFTNQPTNSGMLQYQLVINQSGGAASQAQLARLPLVANTAELLNNPALADIFPQANPVGGRIAGIDKNFKLPQVWRSSLGVDIKLPLNMMLTLEGVYTKDMNSINFDNINLADAATTVIEGTYTRPYWSNSTNATKYLTSVNGVPGLTPPIPAGTTSYQNVVIMRNTNKGQGYSLSAELELPRIAGFSGMIAYSRSWSEEVAGKSGSDPFSAWQYRYVAGSSNSDELGLSLNNTPHRVIGSLNYSIDYAKYFRTSISIFYNGFKGNAASYYYNGDANGDGTTNDLMYIPRDASDVIFASQADADAYFAFAAQDPYLSKHPGEVALRNSAYTPWNERIDVRLLQDFKLNVKGTAHTLELSVDVINAANLLNSSWGLNKSFLTTSPLTPQGRDNATGKMKVAMRKIGSDYMTKTYQDPTSVAGTWALQVGLRYLFN